MKIILTGFMGSGKSAVAMELANRLNHHVLEMDNVVLERNRVKDMRELFDKGDEVLLRQWEIRLAEEWRDIEHAIISTGGGVVINKIILDYLKEGGGKTVFLHAPFHVLSERIKKDTTQRPLFQNLKTAEDLYNFRLPLYKKYADIIIHAEQKPVSKIVEEIIEQIKL